MLQAGGERRIPGQGGICPHGRPGLLRRGGEALLHVRPFFFSRFIVTIT